MHNAFLSPSVPQQTVDYELTKRLWELDVLHVGSQTCMIGLIANLREFSARY